MNPEKRFGQIEEVLAEALVKIDRIEDLATKTFSVAEEAKHNGETTARAVANLTVEVREIKQGVTEIRQDVNTLNTKLDRVEDGQRDIMKFLRDKFS